MTYKTGRTRAGTREALLDAAEALLAEYGLQATSLRQITRKARANLAAVHYHFGSKEALLRAVLARRLGELNGSRLALLDAAEAKAGSRPAALDEILHAFIAPTARLCLSRPDFMRVAGRFHMEAGEKLQAFFYREFREVIRRFMVALTRAVPGIPPREVGWRMQFIAGAMIFTWVHLREMPRMSGGLCPIPGEEEHVARLVAMGVSTLRAPLPGSLRR